MECLAGVGVLVCPAEIRATDRFDLARDRLVSESYGRLGSVLMKWDT